jgi:TetR/AcrR family transcriptional regulator, cholesterol catabolism regulator
MSSVVPRSTRGIGGTARDAIVETAIRMWGERTYADVSVQDIVGEAGTTKGGFYHHFSSKEDLLVEIHDAALDKQIADMREVISLGLPAPETLRRILTRFFEGFADTRNAMHVALHEMRSLDDLSYRRVRRRRSEVEQLWVDVLDRGGRDGDLDLPGPPRLTAFALIGVLAWAYEWFDPTGEISPTALAALTADLLLNGLESRPRPC